MLPHKWFSGGQYEESILSGRMLDCYLFSLMDNETLEYESNSCIHFSAFTAARKLVGNLAVRIAGIFLDNFQILDELLLKVKSVWFT